MNLHTYYRSTSSYGVRITLVLQGLGCRAVPVNLTGSNGEYCLRAFNGRTLMSSQAHQ